MQASLFPIDFLKYTLCISALVCVSLRATIASTESQSAPCELEVYMYEHRNSTNSIWASSDDGDSSCQLPVDIECNVTHKKTPTLGVVKQFLTQSISFLSKNRRKRESQDDSAMVHCRGLKRSKRCQDLHALAPDLKD